MQFINNILFFFSFFESSFAMMVQKTVVDGSLQWSFNITSVGKRQHEWINGFTHVEARSGVLDVINDFEDMMQELIYLGCHTDEYKASQEAIVLLLIGRFGMLNIQDLVNELQKIRIRIRGSVLQRRMYQKFMEELDDEYFERFTSYLVDLDVPVDVKVDAMKGLLVFKQHFTKYKAKFGC